jgi:hypothetical protein
MSTLKNAKRLTWGSFLFYNLTLRNSPPYFLVAHTFNLYCNSFGLKEQRNMDPWIHKINYGPFD